MKNSNRSGNITASSVIMPELSRIFTDPRELDRITSAAFSHADFTERKQLFAMREMLHHIYPNGIPKCSSPEDFVPILECISDFKTSHDLPDGYDILFPGLITPPDDLASHEWTSDKLRRIVSLSNCITLMADTPTHTEFALQILSHAYGTNTDITVLINRRLSEKLYETLQELYEHGVFVTLCDMSCALRMLDTAYGHNGNRFATSNGRLMIPGKTAITCRTISLKKLLSDKKESDQYHQIKTLVKEILDDEISKRFNRSSKRHLYHRPNKELSPLLPWELFYSGCIGKENTDKIREIFSGGADYDVISVTPCDFPSENTADILNCLAAACNYYNGEYPIKIVPHFNDTRNISHDSDIRQIMIDHASFAGNIIGGPMLELYLDDTAEFPEQSLIHGFFGIGGVMLKIKKEVDTHG